MTFGKGGQDVEAGRARAEDDEERLVGCTDVRDEYDRGFLAFVADKVVACQRASRPTMAVVQQPK